MSKKIFYAVLNMGLGHATRSLPLMRHLLQKGNRLVIGSSGRALHFLQKEMPECDFAELPDYQLEYGSAGAGILQLIRQTPKLFAAIRAEQQQLIGLQRSEKFELVISDHRYGCWLKDVPSCFLSHQLRFIAPKFLRSFEFSGICFNRHYQKNFSIVLVPDYPPEQTMRLSGRLSSAGQQEKVCYIGPLASVAKENLPVDIDVLISISGPEPQRSIFEKIVLAQTDALSGKVVVVKGRPEGEEVIERNNLTIYSHLPRRKMSELMNRANIIITRSGYSTMMELAVLGKKALLIPTPGQTEQEYLAAFYQKAGWFHAVSQKKLQLARDVKIAEKFSGFPFSVNIPDSIAAFEEKMANFIC